MALKEYKILNMTTALIDGGILNSKKLEEKINSSALEGWIVKDLSISNPATVAFSQIIIILERDK
jgi:hypothetical protein